MVRRSRRNKKLPEENIQLNVDRISHEGRGIASNNGKVAFVDGALPGERVVASYIGSRARFDELAVVEVLEASPERVDPACSYFGTCGGCSLQHLGSDAQISFKQDFLLDQLQHSADIEPGSFELLESQLGDTYHYRRKARLAVRYVSKKGGALVGFREKYSTFITEMSGCHVLTREIAALIQPLRELVNSLESRMDIPQFEVASGRDVQGDSRVALVMRHLKELSDGDLQRLEEFSRVQACDFYLQPKGPDSIHKIWPREGLDRLYYELPDQGLRMQFHPVDFVQINDGINRKAIALALKLLQLESQDRVLDLFCGLGNFTLPMSRFCKQVVGVEGSEQMVSRAQENAQANRITNVSFNAANLYELDGNEPWLKNRYDKILLDPPRSGALEIIDWLGQSGASRIVYISCNPATLARDTARLKVLGYVLRSAGVMDMFPHTAHVESIAEFELAK